MPRKCPKCKAECSVKAKVCNSCGAELPELKRCSNCGVLILATAKKCGKCGTPNVIITKTEIISNEVSPASQPEEKVGPLAESAPAAVEGQNTIAETPIERQNEPAHDRHEVPGSEHMTQEEETSEKTSSKKGLIIGIVALCVVLLGMGIWFFTSKEKKNSEYFDMEYDWDDNETVDELAEVEELFVEDSYASHGSLSDDILYFEGTIDGKYPIHLILDTRRGHGAYYYDKYGSGNLMGLDDIQLSYFGNGNFTVNMSEYNSKGEYCGSWSGTVNENGFNGGVVVNGKPMSVNLTLYDSSNQSYDPLVNKTLDYVYKAEKYIESTVEEAADAVNSFGGYYNESEAEYY